MPLENREGELSLGEGKMRLPPVKSAGGAGVGEWEGREECARLREQLGPKPSSIKWKWWHEGLKNAQCGWEWALQLGSRTSHREAPPRAADHVQEICSVWGCAVRNPGKAKVQEASKSRLSEAGLFQPMRWENKPVPMIVRIREAAGSLGPHSI